MEKKYFENLDTLRTFACFAVFAAHSMLGVTFLKLWDNTLYQKIITLLSSGSNGVSFFFVLSGFLITHLIILEKKEKGTFSLKNFYFRRFLRIWPLYYMVVIFGFFLYPYVKIAMGMEVIIPYNIFYHLAFLTNFDSIIVSHNKLTGVSPMMIGITWSVAIEEQFYLVWPLLFYFIKERFYGLIFLGVILISLAFRYFNLADDATIYFHSFSVMSDLALGGGCAYLALYNEYFMRFFTNLRKPIIISIYVLGYAALLYPEYLLSPLPYSSVYLRFIYACFFAFIILEQNYSNNSFFKYGKLTKLSQAGKYTYSMYMLHPIGIQVSVVLFKILHISNTDSFMYGIIYVVLALFVSLLLSYLSYRYVESYFLKLKDKYQ